MRDVLERLRQRLKRRSLPVIEDGPLFHSTRGAPPPSARPSPTPPRSRPPRELEPTPQEPAEPTRAPTKTALGLLRERLRERGGEARPPSRRGTDSTAATRPAASPATTTTHSTLASLRARLPAPANDRERGATRARDVPALATPAPAERASAVVADRVVDEARPRTRDDASPPSSLPTRSSRRSSAPETCPECRGTGVVQKDTYSVFCACLVGQAKHDRDLALAAPTVEIKHIVALLAQRAEESTESTVRDALLEAGANIKHASYHGANAVTFLRKEAGRKPAARVELERAADALAHAEHLPPAPPAEVAEAELIRSHLVARAAALPTNDARIVREAAETIGQFALTGYPAETHLANRARKAKEPLASWLLDASSEIRLGLHKLAPVPQRESRPAFSPSESRSASTSMDALTSSDEAIEVDEPGPATRSHANEPPSHELGAASFDPSKLGGLSGLAEEAHAPIEDAPSDEVATELPVDAAPESAPALRGEPFDRKETYQEEYDRVMGRAEELRREGNVFEREAYLEQARITRVNAEGRGIALDTQAWKRLASESHPDATTLTSTSPTHASAPAPLGVRVFEEEGRVKVRFAERPRPGSREAQVMAALKAAGFTWYKVGQAWTKRATDEARKQAHDAVALAGDAADPTAVAEPALVLTQEQASERLVAGLAEHGVRADRSRHQGRWTVRASYTDRSGPKGKYQHQELGEFRFRLEGGLGVDALDVSLRDQRQLTRKLLAQALDGVRVLSLAEVQAGATGVPAVDPPAARSAAAEITREEAASRIARALREAGLGPRVLVTLQESRRADGSPMLVVHARANVRKRRKLVELNYGRFVLRDRGGTGLDAVDAEFGEREPQARLAIARTLAGVRVLPRAGTADLDASRTQAASPATVVTDAAETEAPAAGPLRREYTLPDGARLELGEGMGLADGALALLHRPGQRTQSLHLLDGHELHVPVMQAKEGSREERLLLARLAADRGSLQAEADWHAADASEGSGASLRFAGSLSPGARVPEPLVSEDERARLPRELRQRVDEAEEAVRKAAAAALPEEAYWRQRPWGKWSTKGRERMRAVAEARIEEARAAARALSDRVREAIDLWRHGATNEPPASRPTSALPRGSATTSDADPMQWVVEAYQHLVEPPIPLVWVPDLVRRLSARMSVNDAIEALREARRRGVLELRPESGINRLSAEDGALCPRDLDGVPLSNARLLIEPSQDGTTKPVRAAAPLSRTQAAEQIAALLAQHGYAAHVSAPAGPYGPIRVVVGEEGAELDAMGRYSGVVVGWIWLLLDGRLRIHPARALDQDDVSRKLEHLTTEALGGHAIVPVARVAESKRVGAFDVVQNDAGSWDARRHDDDERETFASEREAEAYARRVTAQHASQGFPANARAPRGRTEASEGDAHMTFDRDAARIDSWREGAPVVVLPFEMRDERGVHRGELHAWERMDHPNRPPQYARVYVDEHGERYGARVFSDPEVPTWVRDAMSVLVAALPVQPIDFDGARVEPSANSIRVRFDAAPSDYVRGELRRGKFKRATDANGWVWTRERDSTPEAWWWARRIAFLVQQEGHHARAIDREPASTMGALSHRASDITNRVERVRASLHSSESYARDATRRLQRGSSAEATKTVRGLLSERAQLQELLHVYRDDGSRRPVGEGSRTLRDFRAPLPTTPTAVARGIELWQSPDHVFVRLAAEPGEWLGRILHLDGFARSRKRGEELTWKQAVSPLALYWGHWLAEREAERDAESPDLAAKRFATPLLDATGTATTSPLVLVPPALPPADAVVTMPMRLGETITRLAEPGMEVTAWEARAKEKLANALDSESEQAVRTVRDRILTIVDGRIVGDDWLLAFRRSWGHGRRELLAARLFADQPWVVEAAELLRERDARLDDDAGPASRDQLVNDVLDDVLPETLSAGDRARGRRALADALITLSRVERGSINGALRLLPPRRGGSPAAWGWLLRHELRRSGRAPWMPESRALHESRAADLLNLSDAAARKVMDAAYVEGWVVKVIVDGSARVVLPEGVSIGTERSDDAPTAGAPPSSSPGAAPDLQSSAAPDTSVASPSGGGAPALLSALATLRGKLAGLTRTAVATAPSGEPPAPSGSVAASEAEDASGAPTWVTGRAVDRSGIARYTHLVRAKDDPERMDIRKVGGAIAEALGDTSRAEVPSSSTRTPTSVALASATPSPAIDWRIVSFAMPAATEDLPNDILEALAALDVEWRPAPDARDDDAPLRSPPLAAAEADEVRRVLAPVAGVSEEDVSAEYVYGRTKAPESYDGFGTLTVAREAGGTRIAAVRADNLDWQVPKYQSGLYAFERIESLARAPSDLPPHSRPVPSSKRRALSVRPSDAATITAAGPAPVSATPASTHGGYRVAVLRIHGRGEKSFYTIEPALRARLAKLANFEPAEWGHDQSNTTPPVFGYGDALERLRDAFVEALPPDAVVELHDYVMRGWAFGRTHGSAARDLPNVTRELKVEGDERIVAVERYRLGWQVARWGGSWTAFDADDATPTMTFSVEHGGRVRHLSDGTWVVFGSHLSDGDLSTLAIHTDLASALATAEHRNATHWRQGGLRTDAPRDYVAPTGVPSSAARVIGWKDGGPVVELRIVLPRGTTEELALVVRGYLPSGARRTAGDTWRRIEKIPLELVKDGAPIDRLGRDAHRTLQRLVFETLEALPDEARVKPKGPTRTPAPFAVGEHVRYIGPERFGLVPGTIGVVDYIRRPREADADLAEVVLGGKHVELVAAGDPAALYERVGADLVADAPPAERLPAPILQKCSLLRSLAARMRARVKLLSGQIGTHRHLASATRDEATRDDHTRQVEELRRQVWRHERVERLAEAAAKEAPPEAPTPAPEPLPVPEDIEARREAFVEKREQRIEGLRAAGEKRLREGQAIYAQTSAVLDTIPLGQPNIVDTVSGRRFMRQRERLLERHGRSFKVMDEGNALLARAASAEDNTAIFSDDPDAIDKLKAEIASREKKQAHMKAVNVAVRANDREKLAAMGLSEATIAELFKPDFVGRVGYPAYALSNNQAQIQRMRARIAELERQRRAGPKDPERYGAVEVREEDNRVRIVFPGKPSEPDRAWLKSHGFKWAPSASAWQRHASPGAWYDAQEIARKLGGPRVASAESTTEATTPSFEKAFTEAFDRLIQGRLLVKLSALRTALPFDRESFDRGLHALRVHGPFYLDTFDGRHGQLEPGDEEAAIREADRTFIYVGRQREDADSEPAAPRAAVETSARAQEPTQAAESGSGVSELAALVMRIVTRAAEASRDGLADVGDVVEEARTFSSKDTEEVHAALQELEDDGLLEQRAWGPHPPGRSAYLAPRRLDGARLVFARPLTLAKRETSDDPIVGYHVMLTTVVDHPERRNSTLPSVPVGYRYDRADFVHDRARGEARIAELRAGRTEDDFGSEYVAEIGLAAATRHRRFAGWVIGPEPRTRPAGTDT